ncbi:hypothetical protein SUNI508_08947 [Seiridium unicorne]|uniref:Uncharacterized protein n=1 Tax=Seiridium unicorne TaxID=138068 RepID=A0ABR2URS8_9PEZI
MKATTNKPLARDQGPHSPLPRPNTFANGSLEQRTTRKKWEVLSSCMNAPREAAQMEQSIQVSAPSSHLTEGDLESMKVVLSDLAERLDRFVESFAGDEFSDELRTVAKDLVGVMTEHLKNDSLGRDRWEALRSHQRGRRY